MRLLLTRPPEESLPLKAKLESAGFGVSCLPLIEIVPPSDGGAALQKELQEIAKYRWLVFTSRHAVDAVAKHLTALPTGLKAAAVGSKTAEKIRERGWSVCLLEEIADKNLKGQKVLYPRSSIGLDKWVERLERAGGVVTVVEAYQTRGKEPVLPDPKEKIDAVLFFSPSAVREFVSWQGDGFAPLAMTVAMIPFGFTTAKELVKQGFKPAFIPSASSEEVFIRELSAFFRIRG